MANFQAVDRALFGPDLRRLISIAEGYELQCREARHGYDEWVLATVRCTRFYTVHRVSCLCRSFALFLRCNTNYC